MVAPWLPQTRPLLNVADVEKLETPKFIDRRTGNELLGKAEQGSRVFNNDQQGILAAIEERSEQQADTAVKIVSDAVH